MKYEPNWRIACTICFARVRDGGGADCRSCQNTRRDPIPWRELGVDKKESFGPPGEVTLNGKVIVR
jgi:hypothetical protein